MLYRSVHLLKVAAILGLVLIGFSPRVEANLLANPSFEIGTGDSIASWSPWGDAKIEPWAAASGSNGLAFYGWTSGGGVYQDVEAGGFSNYTFTVQGWRDLDFNFYNYYVQVRMEFLDSSYNAIDFVQCVVRGTNRWDAYTLSAPSPRGAARVRVVMSFSGSPGTGGGFKWDDTSLTSLPYPVTADVHYCSPTGTMVYPYTNRQTASRSIQAAVRAANTGDTVLAEAGLYNMASQIVVNAAMHIRGESGQTNAIVDAQGLARCFYVTAPGTVLEDLLIRNGRLSGSLTNMGAGVYAVGTTIRHCAIEQNRLVGVSSGDWVTYVLWGAGAYLSGGSIEDCVVRDNSATDGQPRGAGVYATDGAVVSSCIISDNNAVGGWYAGGYYGNAAYGGGIYAGSGCTIRLSSIVSNCAAGAYGYYGAGSGVGAGIYCSGASVSNCTVSHNFAEGADQGRGSGSGGAGAGIYAIEDSRLDRCIVTRNTAKGGDSPSSWDGGWGGGGGIYCWNSTVWNCLVAANTATGGLGNGGYGGSAQGGGIRAWGGEVAHCTLVDNVAEGGVGSYANGAGYGGGLYNLDGAAINCLAYFNTAPSNANLLLSGAATASSCWTNADPVFQDRASGNYRLLPASPCIDAGTAVALDHDLDGIPRPLDGNNDGFAAFDIGAYEFLHPLADSDGDGLADTNELVTTRTNPARPDSDGDGMTDGNEIWAGTDALDDSSLLAIRSAETTNWTPSGIVVRWPSAAGRTYCLRRATNLVNGFTAIAIGIAPTPPENHFTDTSASGDGPYFYKVSVEEPD